MTFISNNWADAHQQTRLKALTQSGFQIDCLAVFRNYYPVKTDIIPKWIGKVDHASYAKRPKTYFSLLFQLIKNLKSNQIAYVYGFDLALVVVLFKVFSLRNVFIIYEVPDIREVFFSSGIWGKSIRFFEKLAIPRINLLVATSPEFITEYFIKFRKIKLQDFRIIENKVHYDQLPGKFERQTSIVSPKIKIGYFGVLRCRASLDCLILLASENQFEIILQGIFMAATSDFEKRIQDLENIQYLGSYHVPDDLSKIYNNVDIVWAAYPFSNNNVGNHLWARTNRYYESLFFHKPLILQKNSADAKQAKMLENVAIEIDLANIKQAASRLSSVLTPNFLLTARRSLLKVPEHHYLITTEYKNLVMCLQQNKLSPEGSGIM
ncbi:hypothetical protein [Dyadobacter sp. CY345]|uniref:hypothetical protein n=1 Tax=Dyadobacter sp. CY345 TaxID=2909335 RepID=UPI001F3B14D9|nr:hypothetical protein [Dyadobacter sp. CY345]